MLMTITYRDSNASKNDVYMFKKGTCCIILLLGANLQFRDKNNLLYTHIQDPAKKKLNSEVSFEILIYNFIIKSYPV